MILLKNAMKAIANNIDRAKDIADSFSNNQFEAKESLVNTLINEDIINPETNVVIIGSWYGSILIELLASRVNSIVCVDMDDLSIRISKSMFMHYDNVKWITADITTDVLRRSYYDATLFINTSCEHMIPMKDLEILKHVKNPYFAFQSNNMFDIEGHINCVNNIEEFKRQLPKCMIFDEQEIEDTRGVRFSLIGQLC